ncbi:hypothetical protein F3Q50_16960, partial [Salmonella enterica subsp. enterica]|nr:hypothetical protein [Salmonella enterica subsp. enterica]
MNLTINHCIVLFNILFVVVYMSYLFKIKAFKMNAESLTHQPLFKAALTIPIISFFLLGFVAWNGHDFQIDTEGFNNFLNISKLPLAVLSLSIPLGVVVNNIHRTIQTDKQIKEAEKKNKVDFFYAHRKNTIEALQHLESLDIPLIKKNTKLEFENCYSTYRKCYPYASTTNSNFDASKDYIQNAELIWRQLVELFKKEEINDYIELYTHIYRIEKLLEI